MLSVAATAVKLGRSTSSIYRMIHKQRIPFVRDGRRLFIERAAVEAMIPLRPATSARDFSETATPSVPSGSGRGQRDLPVPAPLGPRVVFFVC
jgi:excisionase family DNA binding protein